MIARALAVGIVCAPFISAALLGLHQAGRRARHAYRRWEWAALNCPHRSQLRRYRWPLAIRLAPLTAWTALTNHRSKS